MKFLDLLERKFGRYAIHGLTRWIVLANILGYVAIYTDRSALDWMALDRERVLQGQLWRLITYLFIPQSLSPFFVIFVLFFTYTIGEGLEQEWGAFRLNLYYFIGMLATTLIAFLFQTGAVTNTYLNTSLFLAFATLFPNFEVLLFLILPVRMKWLGLLTAAFLGFQFILGPNGIRMAILVSLANYFIFFSEKLREGAKLRQQVGRARAKFKEESDIPTDRAFHHCKVCHRTENTDPELFFRVASDGEEYCTEHLPKKTY